MSGQSSVFSGQSDGDYFDIHKPLKKGNYNRDPFCTVFAKDAKDAMRIVRRWFSFPKGTQAIRIGRESYFMRTRAVFNLGGGR